MIETLLATYIWWMPQPVKPELVFQLQPPILQNVGVSGSGGVGTPEVPKLKVQVGKPVAEPQPTPDKTPPPEGWNADNSPGFGETCWSTTQCLDQYYGTPNNNQGSDSTPEGVK